MVYACRTHAQAKQVVAELHKTVYSGVNAVLLGGRDQLCAEPKMKESPIRDWYCSYLRDVQRRAGAEGVALATKVGGTIGCTLHQEANLRAAQTRVAAQRRCLDIEDMYQLCVECSACPYYVTLARAQEVQVLVLPTCTSCVPIVVVVSHLVLQTSTSWTQRCVPLQA